MLRPRGRLRRVHPEPGPVAPPATPARIMNRRRLMIGFAGLGLGLSAPVGWRAARQRVWAPHSGAAFEPWSRWPPERDTPALEQALLAATLAPSNLNTQPWRFHAEGDRVDVYVDPALPAAVADPFGRERCLSVGCAIENFVIAARTVGLSASVALVPGRLDAV